MRNFNIYSKGENNTIEILGSIGQNWFEEGSTLETVKAQIENLQGRNITVKIASLGGDVFEGLAIHDLLKASKKKVTAKIIGATASAGTIVALGADNIEISENSLFLVHNSWTGVMGNADDLRKMAEDLDTIDNRIVSIYTSKTGKPEAEIRALMKEDKWIDAEEAKSWGFVDTITTPIKAAASTIKMINASELPKINEQLINKLNKTEFKMTEENKGWFASQFQALKESLTPKAEAPVAAPVQEEVVSKAEVESQLEEINAMIQEINASKKSIQEELATAKAELEAAQKALANASAQKVDVKAEGGSPDGEEITSNDVYASIRKMVIARRNA